MRKGPPFVVVRAAFSRGIVCDVRTYLTASREIVDTSLAGRSAMSTAQLVVTAVVLEGRNNHSRALARIASLLRAIFSQRDVATLGHRAAAS